MKSGILGLANSNMNDRNKPKFVTLYEITKANRAMRLVSDLLEKIKSKEGAGNLTLVPAEKDKATK